MRHRRLLVFAAVSTLFISSALAQSTSLGLGARFTASGEEELTGDELGFAVAISGDTAVAIQLGYAATGAHVYQRAPGGWASETQTSRLTPSDGGDSAFGSTVAISGDTVVVGAFNKVYVFVKPAAGWRTMNETAQLVGANGGRDGFGQFLAIDGDTIVVGAQPFSTPGPQSAAYVFVKPSGGWATTSTYSAKLTTPNENGILSAGISGDSVVLGYTGAAYVFEKPSGGWATTGLPKATLTRSAPAGPNDTFGLSIAISGDRIAVGDRAAGIGVVDLFVEPETGWADATETVELSPPTTPGPTLNFGDALAMDSSHLVVGSTTDEIFVYSQPPAGWGASAWPSQELTGNSGSFFGSSVAIDGQTVVGGAPRENINGNQIAGAAYLFTLFPNWIQVSTDFLEFPDMTFGSSEIVPVTVKNLGTGTLTFTTTMDSPNYQVVQGSENTCSAGVPAGQSCVLPIKFNPPGVGQHTNHLTLTSPSSASVSVIEMQGLAGGVGAANEGYLNFGTINDGTTVTLPLVIENFGVPGSPTVAVSSSSPYFSLASQGTCAAGVAEGTTCTLMLKFAPVDPGGFFSEEITLTPSSGAASMISVQGVGYDTSLTP